MLICRAKSLRILTGKEKDEMGPDAFCAAGVCPSAVPGMGWFRSGVGIAAGVANSYN